MECITEHDGVEDLSIAFPEFLGLLFEEDELQWLEILAHKTDNNHLHTKQELLSVTIKELMMCACKVKKNRDAWKSLTVKYD